MTRDQKSDETQLRTKTVRAGIGRDRQHGSVIPPIVLSSTFSFEGFARPRTYDYTRSGNPTRALLEETMAELEGGAGAVAVGSGMAAATLVAHWNGPQALLLAPHDLYGGCHRLFSSLAERTGFRVRFVNFSDETEWLRALQNQPGLVWLETPSNPLLRVVDVRRIAERAHAIGARVVVDNTFLSPVHQRPLELGADLVIHSTTKSINGHSDVVGGVVVAKDRDVATELAWWSNCLGLGQAPYDCAQISRGLRTLHARWRLHEENAQAVATLLEGHPAVDRVYYPGLRSSPYHRLAQSQQSGFGAIVSAELSGGVGAVQRLFERVKLFSVAESLGGVESLVCHPATMTHAAMAPEARTRAGIGESLVRFSVGIEAGEDLLSDLDTALNAAAECPEPASTPALRCTT